MCSVCFPSAISPAVLMLAMLVLRLDTSFFLGLISCLLAKGQNLESPVAVGSGAGLQSD